MTQTSKTTSPPARKTKAAESLPREKSIEVSPKDVTVNSLGQCMRDLLIRMPAGAVADDLRDPAIWKRVQEERNVALIKMDQLFILGHAEDWYARAIVSYATHTEAHLVIEKVGSFRAIADILFSDGTYEIYWSGSAYGVRRQRDRVAIGGQGFATVGMARDHIRTLYPKSPV